MSATAKPLNLLFVCVHGKHHSREVANALQDRLKAFELSRPVNVEYSGVTSHGVRDAFERAHHVFYLGTGAIRNVYKLEEEQGLTTKVHRDCGAVESPEDAVERVLKRLATWVEMRPRRAGPWPRSVAALSRFWQPAARLLSRLKPRLKRRVG